MSHSFCLGCPLCTLHYLTHNPMHSHPHGSTRKPSQWLSSFQSTYHQPYYIVIYYVCLTNQDISSTRAETFICFVKYSQCPEQCQVLNKYLLNEWIALVTLYRIYLHTNHILHIRPKLPKDKKYILFWALINSKGLCKNKEVQMSWLFLGHKHITGYTEQQKIKTDDNEQLQNERCYHKKRGKKRKSLTV